MLILLTLFLVLVGTVSLIIGFIQNSLVPIYASIGCSVAAALVLVLYSRLANRPAPAVRRADTGAMEQEEEPERAETASAASDLEAGAVPEPILAEAPTAAPEPVTAAEPAAVGPAAQNPIPDYPRLKVGEIVPLLAGLTSEQLHAVRQAEEKGKSRTTVLNRIDQLLNAGPGTRRPARPAKKAGASSRAAKVSGSGTAAKRAAKKAPASSLKAGEPTETEAAPAVERASTGPTVSEPGAVADESGPDAGTGDVVWDPSAGNGNTTSQTPSSQTEAGTS